MKNLVIDGNGIARDKAGAVVEPRQGETGMRLVYPPLVEVGHNGVGITYNINPRPVGVEPVTFDCIFGWYSREEGFENKQREPRLAP